MPKGAVRVGDLASGHECHFPATPSIEGSSDVFINGIPATKQGDAFAAHSCSKCDEPEHARKLSGGSGSVFINGKPAGRVGDPISCGGTVSEGSANVLVGD